MTIATDQWPSIRPPGARFILTAAISFDVARVRSDRIHAVDLGLQRLDPMNRVTTD